MTRVFLRFWSLYPEGKKAFFRKNFQAYNQCGFLSMQRKEVKKYDKISRNSSFS